MIEGDDPSDFGLPPLDTEAGRDEWIDELLEYDEWECDAMIVKNGDDLVMRVRYADGSEEIFDCIVRRSMSVVEQVPEGEKN